MHTAFSPVEATSNPFAQMVDRSRVLAAVYRSDRINALASHVFHPLGGQPKPVEGEVEVHDLDGYLDD